MYHLYHHCTIMIILLGKIIIIIIIIIIILIINSFVMDSELIYTAFFADFGPLHLGLTYK